MAVRIRRCAANQVVTLEREVLAPGVVEMENGEVVACYLLRGEQPMTEWLGGKIEIKRDDMGVLRAHHQGKILEY